MHVANPARGGKQFTREEFIHFLETGDNMRHILSGAATRKGATSKIILQGLSGNGRWASFKNEVRGFAMELDDARLVALTEKFAKKHGIAPELLTIEAAERAALKLQIAAAQSGGQSASIAGMSISRVNYAGLHSQRVMLEKRIQRLYRGGRGFVVDASYGVGL
jgi:hypothetical protein